jgi:hypothetical protein
MLLHCLLYSLELFIFIKYLTGRAALSGEELKESPENELEQGNLHHLL